MPCYCTHYQHTEHKFPSTLGYSIMLYTTLQQKIQSHFQVEVLFSYVCHVWSHKKFRKFHQLPCYDATKNSENSINFPTFFYAIPLSLRLEPAERSNGEILLIIFHELEHIPALKKYQWCRQNTFGGDQYGYNEKGSSYNIWESWETWFYSISTCLHRKIIWTSGYM